VKPTLYYLGQPADGFGWGVANTNLVKALSEFCNVVVVNTTRETFDHPVFIPVTDQTLKPLRKVKAPRVIGYCFTEWPIPEGAHRESRCYDVLLAGSTWNAERLRDAGCRNVDVMVQGIDHDRFKPQPWRESSHFVVFSGGKLEFRKGQDYVLAAMRPFMKFHEDVKLLCAWHNPWPQSIATMSNSWLLDREDPFKDLPKERIIQLPSIPNEKMPEVYGNAHIGLFPNRCEAGNNMVMCEFMGCARPVIATYAHGHRDVFWKDFPYLITTGDYDPAGWFNPPVADLISALEHAYRHRDTLPSLGQEANRIVSRFTWRDCALKVFSSAFPPKGQDRAPQSKARESESLQVAR